MNRSATFSWPKERCWPPSLPPPPRALTQTPPPPPSAQIQTNLSQEAALICVIRDETSFPPLAPAEQIMD